MLHSSELLFPTKTPTRADALPVDPTLLTTKQTRQLRAAKSFERCAVDGEPSRDLAMRLHVVEAIYCSLGRFEEVIPVLERAMKVPEVSRGADHALPAFSGYMQLGDTHSMLGQLDRSIDCYKDGLKIQMETLGDADPRVAETC